MRELEIVIDERDVFGKSLTTNSISTTKWFELSDEEIYVSLGVVKYYGSVAEDHAAHIDYLQVHMQILGNIGRRFRGCKTPDEAKKWLLRSCAKISQSITFKPS
jgi:hypothetical protein